jgi:hypothetical protein
MSSSADTYFLSNLTNLDLRSESLMRLYQSANALPRCARRLSIQALLGAPNPDDPLANDVAQNWKEDEKAAIAQAKEWTRIYAQ